MRYLSPIRFYTHCGVDLSDPTAINASRLKKMVSAEFAMAPDGVVTIYNFSYNKNDILQDLDNPEWEKYLGYHLTIWNTAGLLNFLETDTIHTFKARKEWFNLSEDPGFVDFISPCFAESFNNVMKIFLNPVDFDEARFWMLFLRFINQDNTEAALASTRIFLDDSIRLFKNTNSQSYWTDFAQIQPWSKQQWHLFINDLPDSLYFYKESLAESLVSLTVEIQHTDQGIAYMISTRLSQMQGLSTNLENIIKKNHEIFANNHSISINAYDSGSGSSQQKESSPVRTFFSILFAVIVIIRFLFMLSKCS